MDLWAETGGTLFQRTSSMTEKICFLGPNRWRCLLEGTQHALTDILMHFLIRPHTGASNLSFFLVMPVQRITKYPLLLQKIVENTLGTDSAYGALQAAATAMADVNANINEYKRRKEIGKGD